jgi:hemoglobin
MASTTIEPAPDTKSDSSLLDRVGGQAGLDALIGAWYFNVLRDDRVACFFSGIDVAAVMAHQRKLLAAALDNDGAFSPLKPRLANERPVEEQGLDFDTLIEILTTTLGDLGHKGDLARSIIRRFAALRDDVLNPEQWPTVEPGVDFSSSRRA